MRRVLPLVAEQWFYSVLILVLVLALAFHLRSVSLLEMIRSLVPALFGHWYIVGYLMLYVLIPFLDPWLRSMEKRTYRRLLLALFIIWSVIPTCTLYNWHFDERDLLWKGLSPNAAHLTGVWVHAPIKILAVFLVCLAIDLLRRATVEKVFLKWLQKLSAAWDKKHAARTAG